MVMDNLSILDMAESKLQHAIVISTSKLAELLNQYVLGSSYVLCESVVVGIVCWW